jgi:hypothetical protein
MRHGEYYRLHEACLAMANQCTEPEVKARWLVMADAWLQRSTEISEHREVMKHEPRAHTGPQSAGATDRGQQTRL